MSEKACPTPVQPSLVGVIVKQAKSKANKEHVVLRYLTGNVYEGKVCTLQLCGNAFMSKEALSFNINVQVRGGRMHGEGKMVWADGTTYEGQFEDNVLQ